MSDGAARWEIPRPSLDNKLIEQKMSEASDFRVLLVYPNLSMMLTPSCAVGIFTKILKESGYQVDLFDW